MSEMTDNDTSVIQHLEEQFKEKEEYSCGFSDCNEKAIWKRTRGACCGAVSYTCGMHKYGRWTTGTPCWPGVAADAGADPNIVIHAACKTRLTWTDVLMKDEWVHL